MKLLKRLGLLFMLMVIGIVSGTGGSIDKRKKETIRSKD